VRKALGDRGYITGQTIAAQTKNLKGDISLAALDAPVIASLQATDPRQKLPDSISFVRAVRILLPSSAKFAAAAILNISIPLSAVVLVEGIATVITGEQ
jgi:hypothetical protein